MENSLISCLHSDTKNPFCKGSTLKGKNLLPLGANSFLLEKTPFQKGGENSFDRVEGVSMPLNDPFLYTRSVSNLELYIF